MNLVKGVKLYEIIFTDSELTKLTNFVTDLRTAGQSGELSGRAVKQPFPMHLSCPGIKLLRLVKHGLACARGVKYFYALSITRFLVNATQLLVIC